MKEEPPAQVIRSRVGGFFLFISPSEPEEIEKRQKYSTTALLICESGINLLIAHH
ncbi:MAG: hypothetical protein RMM08_01620 [Armatimonadota bacterium]|nr:hypothetical protein [Armatimonadota bacterium]